MWCWVGNFTTNLPTLLWFITLNLWYGPYTLKSFRRTSLEISYRDLNKLTSYIKRFCWSLQPESDSIQRICTLNSNRTQIDLDLNEPNPSRPKIWTQPAWHNTSTCLTLTRPEELSGFFKINFTNRITQSNMNLGPNWCKIWSAELPNPKPERP